MNHLSDLELVEQARGCGDKQALGLLLERHQAGALRMAGRMIAHQDTARELVQEAMLQAYLSLDSLQKPERFQSWLYGIVINVCRNYLRRRHDEYLSFEALSGGLEASPILNTGHAPDPQRIVEMRELHELVLNAIGSLSPPNREVVLLFYYDQLSLREISAVLGISTAAVKGRLYKSRQHLAERFATYAAHGNEWFAPPQSISTGTITTGTLTEEGKEAMADIQRVEVKVVDVIILDGDREGHHVIILHDEAGQRVLPIWVGPFEGNSIAMKLLNDTLVPRPMTYDFMASLVKACGAIIDEIHISGLQGITYYATAMLRVGEAVHEIDARPSDAMALALRLQSKIFVEEGIMAKAGVAIPAKYKDRLPHKGLEQLAAKMEETKREMEETMARFKEKQEQAKEEATQEEVPSPTDRLFAHLFGE